MVVVVVVVVAAAATAAVGVAVVLVLVLVLLEVLLIHHQRCRSRLRFLRAIMAILFCKSPQPYCSALRS